ncbi:dTMP kinase [Dongia deserti]|uniref:dTMP kinase n=1 Tax=Dongia deserti TaxID=2268030 RepID=UPI000E6507B8|nr:dTMP kinase [Dongia deserti]
MTRVARPKRFIVFEGGEGAGKSTQVQRLAEALRARGADVVTTREPGGSPGAEAIRALLVSGEAERWSPEAEALLINAARADHLDRAIRPALAKGQWVICDRFADSTMAYQGYGMGLDRAWLELLRKRVVGETEPGLTLVFDLPVAVGLGRAIASQRYEKMGNTFHETLRAAFQEIARAKDGRKRVEIDAGKEADAVAREVFEAVAVTYGLKA